MVPTKRSSVKASSPIMIAASFILILCANIFTSAHAADSNPLDLWRLDVVREFPLRRLVAMTYCESLDVAFITGGMNSGTRMLQSASRDIVYDFNDVQEVNLDAGSPLPANSIKPMLFELQHLSTPNSCVFVMGGGVPIETSGARGFSASPGPIPLWVGELYRAVEGDKTSSLRIRWNELTLESIGSQPDQGPVNRLFFAATSLNNATYIYGGVHNEATLSDEMWKLEVGQESNINGSDTSFSYSATWTPLHMPAFLAQSPGDRVFAAMTSLPKRNLLVLSGGWLNSNLRLGAESDTQSNLVWTYSILNGNWTIERVPSENALEFARYRHTLTSYNDQVFMIGGFMGLSQRQIAPSGLYQSSLGKDPLSDCGSSDKGLWCTYPTFSDYFEIGDGVDTCIMRQSEMVCLMASTNAVSSINLDDIPVDEWKRAVEELPNFSWYPFGVRVTPLFIGITGVMLYVCLSSLRRMHRHGARTRSASSARTTSGNNGIELSRIHAGAEPDVISNLPLVKYNAKEAQNFWHHTDAVMNVTGPQNAPQINLDAQKGADTEDGSGYAVGNGNGVSSPYKYESLNPNSFPSSSSSNDQAIVEHLGYSDVQSSSGVGAQSIQSNNVSDIISTGTTGSIPSATTAPSDAGSTAGGPNGTIGLVANDSIEHVHSNAGIDLRTRSSTIMQDDCCSICLVEFEAEESLRQLPCGHLYHPECVDVWLLGNASCPLCKASILEPALAVTSTTAHAAVGEQSASTSTSTDSRESVEEMV